MKKNLVLNHIIVCLLTLSPLSLLGAPKPAPKNTNFDIINVIPVNESGKKLSSFKRGQYIRVDWSAYYNNKNINDNAFSGSLNLKASCQAVLFGKKISYSINLPLSGTGGSLKSIFNTSSDSDILNSKQSYKEFTDFYIPEELPPGKVTIELTGKTSVKNIQPISFKKTIDLK
jgi:hypothetical protein